MESSEQRTYWFDKLSSTHGKVTFFFNVYLFTFVDEDCYVIFYEFRDLIANRISKTWDFVCIISAIVMKIEFESSILMELYRIKYKTFL